MMHEYKGKTVDMLCVGAHPDDIEIGMAGTICKHIHAGFTIGIVDLTKAELSSNGTVEERKKEASEAALIMDVDFRMQMGFPDRGLEINDSTISALVDLLRQTRPRVVFIPDATDRHPDHQMAAKLVREAVFNAGIGKYTTPQQAGKIHKVDHILEYMINSMGTPDIILDISAHISQKEQALLAYKSQFQSAPDRVQTRLNEDFLEVIIARDRLLGKQVNVSFAEGFFSRGPLLVHTLLTNREEDAK